MSNQQDNPQVQQQIKQYHQLAQALHESITPDQIGMALEPINSLPEEAQLAFLKVLSKEKNVDAADITLAINTMSTNKEVRKEARRSLVRMESNDTYPEWTPPAVPSLGQAFELASNEENLNMISTDPLLSELQSLLSGAEGFFTGSEYEDTVTTFVEAWCTGDFEEAYNQLASTSSLREDLSRDAWTIRREQWSKEAEPEDEQVSFVHTLPMDTPDQQASVEIGWSLAFTDTPLATSLKELPVATALFTETGRHWFWARYTLIEEDGQWLIETMIDEGANALQLPATEVRSHLETIVELAAQRLAEEDFDDDDEPGEDEDEDEEIDEDEDDEDLLDDDDEDEDDEDFEGTLARMDEAIRVTTQGMHYNDALIAQEPTNSPEPYQQAFSQAMAVNEYERAAVYLQKLAANFPDQRGEALRELAFTYNTLIDTFEDEENDEQADHFRDLTETTLREAIATDNAAAAYILLADLLIEDDERLDEALALLHKAQTLQLDDKEVTLIEAGLAEIAQLRQEPEQALKHYLRVAELAPDFPNISFHLGTLYHQLERNEQAIPYLQRSITTTPDLIEAYAELAAIYTEQQDLVRARQVVKNGLEIEPESVDLITMMALTYIQGGDLKTAEKYLDQAEELDEESELVQTVRGVLNQQKALQRSNPKGKPNNKPGHHHKKKR